jgi:hypothetical protein
LVWVLTGRYAGKRHSKKKAVKSFLAAGQHAHAHTREERGRCAKGKITPELNAHLQSQMTKLQQYLPVAK